MMCSFYTWSEQYRTDDSGCNICRRIATKPLSDYQSLSISVAMKVQILTDNNISLLITCEYMDGK